jgi:DNA repair photolyase
LRERGIISGGSGVSDIYQPAEAELKLTRQCAEVILQADLPAAVATKSSLALRDLDLWGEVAR